MNYHNEEDELQRMRSRKSKNASGRREFTGRGTRVKPVQLEEEEMDLEVIDLDRTSAKSGRRPKKKKSRHLIRNLIIVLLIVMAAKLAWAYFTRQTGLWTIAVFGVDSRDGGIEKNALADVQMLCVVDRGTGEIKLVSVFRDTYLQIDSDGTFHKANEAYFKGGHKQALWTLEENLDLDIDNYATFNWKAVADGINILGGVDLEITDAEFKYINAFITETVESTGIGSVHLSSAGWNHLDGVQAVAYCRLRLMDTDYQRTARQRKVISLALEKAKQADAANLANLVTTVLPQLSTNIGVDELLPMTKNVSKYHLGETGGFPFSKQTALIGKKDCVVATTLESNVIQLHQFLYGDEHYQPSSAVKKISTQISADSGLYDEGTPILPTDSGSSGSSGGSSGGSTPPPETAPPETLPEETAAPDESSSEEETSEEVLIEQLEESEEETSSSDEKGPGVISGTTAHETTSAEEEQRTQGPGEPPETTARPHETTAEPGHAPGEQTPSEELTGPGV